ncbi:unnamed protein product [Amoebophrya sp. A25]|nr:unnamed protein product [Amoebophrya sp. A25]|eukprot:GSA25T00007847001.1
MMTLFEIATTESWVDVMYSGVDSTAAYREPTRDKQQLWGAYFVLFIFFGSFFILNLAVGVIIENFTKVKRETGQSSLFLTDSQKKWVDAHKMLVDPTQFFLLTNLHEVSHFRRQLYTFVSSAQFDGFIMFCILLNTLIMACQVYPDEPTPGYNRLLDFFNELFVLVFNAEAALKLAAMRGSYFKVNWNRFDFLCVSVADLGLILQALQTGDEFAAVGFFAVIRLFRIARLFRLARFMKGLNKLFHAFLLSIPKLVNVGGVFALFLFVYALLGVHLFAKVRFFGDDVRVAEVNEYANFQTFQTSVVTLFRSCTGEAWNVLMHNFAGNRFFYRSVLELECLDEMDMVRDFAHHNERGEVDNPVECGTEWSYVFWGTYTILITYLILNLFIAVIFESFDETAQRDETFSEVVDLCIRRWRLFDVNCTCFLPLNKALEFIEEVIRELGDSVMNTELEKNRRRDRYEKFDLLFTKSLFLRVTPDGNVPVVAAILSVFRYLIIHAGGSVPEAHLSIIHELDAINEKVLASERAAVVSSNPSYLEELTRSQRMRARLSRAAHAFGAGTLLPGKAAPVIPLEQHVAASKIQRHYRQRARRRQVMKDTPLNASVPPGPTKSAEGPSSRSGSSKKARSKGSKKAGAGVDVINFGLHSRTPSKLSSTSSGGGSLLSSPVKGRSLVDSPLKGRSASKHTELPEGHLGKNKDPSADQKVLPSTVKKHEDDPEGLKDMTALDGAQSKSVMGGLQKLSSTSEYMTDHNEADSRQPSAVDVKAVLFKSNSSLSASTYSAGDVDPESVPAMSTTTEDEAGGTIDTNKKER